MQKTNKQKRKQYKQQNKQQTKKEKPSIHFVDIHKQWLKSKQANLTFIDLFSGCGGLTKGLILAGLQPICGLDHNREAV